MLCEHRCSQWCTIRHSMLRAYFCTEAISVSRTKSPNQKAAFVCMRCVVVVALPPLVYIYHCVLFYIFVYFFPTLWLFSTAFPPVFLPPFHYIVHSHSPSCGTLGNSCCSLCYSSVRLPLLILLVPCRLLLLLLLLLWMLVLLLLVLLLLLWNVQALLIRGVARTYRIQLHGKRETKESESNMGQQKNISTVQQQQHNA